MQMNDTTVTDKQVNGATVTDKDTSMKKQINNIPKCPLHPENKSHYLKGCNKFRSLPQNEKFDVMNANGICHRCGHNNCVSGKPPFNPQNCQFFQPCQVPTCGIDTHFSSICPCVYGQDGYRHFETKKRWNPNAEEFKASPQNANMVAHGKIASSDIISCALPTVMGYLKHGSKKTLVRILLDTGSQVSLLREGMVPKSDNDNTYMQDFSLTTVGGDTKNLKLRVVECAIESLDGSFTRKVRLTEMKKPCGDIPIITNAQLQEYPHLKTVDITEASSNIIDVLLGVENGDILTPDEKIIGPEEGPIAARCPLGWYIQGGSSQENLRINTALNFVQVSAAGELEDFLGIEKVGLEPKRCKCDLERENKRATETMRQSLSKLEDGGYQISLPWKRPPTELPNNYDHALKRFSNLERQFQNKPKEWEIYCKQMEDQLKRGVAREVSKVELEQDQHDGEKHVVSTSLCCG